MTGSVQESKDVVLDKGGSEWMYMPDFSLSPLALNRGVEKTDYFFICMCVRACACVQE